MADIHGKCDEQFEAVRGALARNLDSGEELGASLVLDTSRPWWRTSTTREQSRLPDGGPAPWWEPGTASGCAGKHCAHRVRRGLRPGTRPGTGPKAGRLLR